MHIKSVFKNLPYQIKQPIKYLYGAVPPSIRLGKAYWQTYHFLQESQWWSEEKLKAYQMEQLEKLLRHAYENVPYYKRIFTERGLKPKDIQDFNDLQKLPCITKDDIKNNIKELTAQNFPESKLEYKTTGGSTGIPMGFYQEKYLTEQKEQAFIVNHWERVSFVLGARTAVFEGKVIHSKKGEGYWKYNQIEKRLMFCVYNMTI